MLPANEGILRLVFVHAKRVLVSLAGRALTPCPIVPAVRKRGRFLECIGPVIAPRRSYNRRNLVTLAHSL
ncbi:unnamed protein product, partial [Iphiclides podalirius]